MGAFLKFVLALAANILWRRIGGKDTAPPMRMPRGKNKRPVDIPVLAPWQMVVATWVARKLWAQVGTQVKDTLASSPNNAARQVGSWLPDPPAPQAPAKPQVAKAPGVAQPAHTATSSAPRAPQTWTAPATPAPKPAPAPAAPKSPAAPAPAPPRDYGTRRLDDGASTAGHADEEGAQTDAPPPASKPSRASSLLSSLRRGWSH